MRKNLKNSVALSLVLSLSMPVTVFSQEAGGDCDPASDAECAALEAEAEPTAETSEEEAPAEEVEIEADASDADDPAAFDEDAAASDEGTTDEDTASTEGEATEEDSELTEEEATEDAPSDTQEETAEASDDETLEVTSEDETAESTETEIDSTETEAAAGAEPATPKTETPEEETAETTAPAEEMLEIEEPETVLSEDTGLTEEAAAAEAAAAEELSETAPVAAATDGGATTESGAEPEVDVTTVTEESSRTSEEEFASSDDSDGGGLSTLEKLLVVGVGAAVLGELIDNNRVVQNTGDRVILQRADGSLYVLRDDDVLLRRPGYNVETRTYSDGSTVNEITKSDGSVVRTIRDPRGHVLRRTRILSSGREIVLFDDTADIEPVSVEDLPLRRSSSLDYADADAALEDALSAELQADVGRRFSLRQVRNIRAVRELVPVIDLEAVTFDTNSAAIRASEARRLDRLGNAMRSVIDERPWEVFLIEGHTDAVGSAVANLTLSDRRAESLALALTEYYDIPSENLVVQGYGERYLKVPVATDERANRRVTVRRITPLLGMKGTASGPANEATSITVGAVGSSDVSQDAIDSCIDELRATEGATGGTVLRTEFSEANSVVMLSDGSGAVWRCLVSNDGTDPYVEAEGRNASGEDTATADDGEGAMDGASSETVMPSVGSPTDVTDFVGAPAGQAPGGLQALGFESIRSEGLTTFWFNRETGACARITTSDGVYSDVTMLPAEDC